MITSYILRLRVKEVSREFFLDTLENTLIKSSYLGYWQHFKWEFNDDK